MKTFLRMLLRISAAALLLSGCAYATRVVRDDLDRNVTVPDHPRRLICLAPSITDTVYRLGRGGDIVGITDYTKYPAESAEKPSVGGIINPSLEKIVSLQPDLALAVADLNSLELVNSIEHLGIPVFVIHPLGLEGIYRSIESIGNVIDQKSQATELVAGLRRREQTVRQRVAGKRSPTVFYILWHDPIMTAGHSAFITELIEIAGGRSISSDLPAEWTRISLEVVIARQPQYLLLVRGSQTTLETLQHLANWQKLDAVRNSRVFYVDDRMIFSSPIALDALEELAKEFHP
ncbi:MAG: cobalamin-binding protein [Acidobacteriia bacterium]|nr:cobalamin-binding protein [Terriglobia bacterium]